MKKARISESKVDQENLLISIAFGAFIFIVCAPSIKQEQLLGSIALFPLVVLATKIYFDLPTPIVAASRNRYEVDQYL